MTSRNGRMGAAGGAGGDPSSSQYWLDRGYSVGSIVGVKMHNFLTYEDCEAIPGPRLNVVIGPNGTGKSAMTHAICLACCGSTSDVGRSSDLSKFVKQGKEAENDCFVEVRILGEKSILTIRRHLHSESRRSEWTINERNTTQTEVKRHMNMLSIDVDNLCSFMPQDRVGQFSRYTPREILQETLKSIRSGVPSLTEDQQPRSLYDDQQMLGKSEEEKEKRKRDWDSKVHALQHINAQLQGMTAELNRLEQRQELMTLRGYLDVRIVKIQADMATAQLREVEVGIQNEQARIQELDLELSPLQNEERKVKKSLAFLEKEEKKLDDSAGTQRLNSLYQSLQKNQDDIAARAAQLSQAATISAGHERERERIEAEIAVVLKELQAAQATPREGDKVAELKAKLNRLRQQKEDETENREVRKREQQDLKRKMERLDRECSNLRDPESNFLRTMENLSGGMDFVREAMQAWQYIRNHEAQWRREGRLRQEWYGPVARHLVVQDPACVVMLEKAIPKNKLMGFIVLNEEDEKLLRTELRERLGLKVDIYTILNRSLPSSAHYPPQVLQGIRSRFNVEIQSLADQVQCPPDVRAFLYSFLQLHTYVWCRTKQSISNELLQALCCEPIRNCRLYVHDLREGNSPATLAGSIYEYSGRKSHYDPNGRPSVASVRCPPARFLSAADAGGQEDFRRQQHELEERRESLRKDLDQVIASLADSEQRLQDYGSTELVLGQELQRELDRQKRPAVLAKQLERLKEKKKQEEERRRQHEEGQPRQRVEYAQAIRQLCAQVHQLVESVRKRTHQSSRRDCVLACKRMWEEKVNTLNAQMQTTRDAIQERRRRVTALESARSRGEADVRRFERELEQMAEEYGGEQTFVNEIYPIILQRCPEKTLDEVETRRYAVIAQINGIVDNPGLLQRHQDLLDQQAQLQQEATSAQTSYQLVDKEMKDRSEHWYRDVQSVVDKLNFSFTESMQQLGFQGRIVLKQVGRISEYELQLQVSFHRDSPLVDLSGTRHSGGERAVSTVMFLMALQSMTSAPFRVVDEINQGMDERNERLVMDRIVSTCCTSRGRTFVPQYFLVSPKLLHALQALDHDDVTILLVWNGPGIFKSWTIDGCLEALRKRRRTPLGNGDCDDDDDDDDDDEQAYSDARGDVDSDLVLVKKEKKRRVSSLPTP